MPGHPSRLEIDVRSNQLGTFTIAVPAEFSLETDTLDRAMAICNRHFGDPDKHIGGPELTKGGNSQ